MNICDIFAEKSRLDYLKKLYIFILNNDAVVIDCVSYNSGDVVVTVRSPKNVKVKTWCGSSSTPKNFKTEMVLRPKND